MGGVSSRNTAGNASGAWRGEAVKACLVVVASEAKQSILSYCGAMDCFASLAMTVSCDHRATLSGRHRPRKRAIQYSEVSVMESRSRSVLDTPLEPVIGLAEGETRWRSMTMTVPERPAA